MSSYLDSIPQAVATIVASVASRLGGTQASQWDAEKTDMVKHVVDLTDQLTRTFVKALEDAEVDDDE